MKKTIKIIGCAVLLAFTGTAYAQLSLPGGFSSEETDGGWMVYCDGDGYCGTIGAETYDGGHFFFASDGSEWVIYCSEDPVTDPEGTKKEFTEGVSAVPIKND